MPEIIGQADPNQTCAEYALGENEHFLDEAIHRLRSGGGYDELSWQKTPLQPGDLVIYGNIMGIPSHIAKVDETGLPVSKIHNNPNIYRHELWEDPIENTLGCEACVIFRASE